MVVEVLSWTCLLAASLLVLMLFPPLIRSGFWFVRCCDFPRIQLAGLGFAGLIAILLIGWMGEWRTADVVTLGMFALVVCWQTAHVIRYTPVWRTDVPAYAGADEHELRVMVSNLDFENTRYDAARSVITDMNPDVLLLVELNGRWERALQRVADRFPYRSTEAREDGRGIALWSHLPLRDTEVRFLVDDDRPSVHADVEFVGGQRVRFIGVHPTPPGLPRKDDEGRHDSRIRDAELVIVAREVADAANGSWIVAGDFNDVAWSHTTRLFKRLSGLVDPRIGRGLYNTYHAERPLLRFPIDHLFLSEGFSIAGMERVRMPGSDHFGIVADVTLVKREGTSPEPTQDDREEARGMVKEGMADAENGDDGKDR
jgi:endonuclease/exonuclease/phosphatase (EEP) superfamily protein YafD